MGIKFLFVGTEKDDLVIDDDDNLDLIDHGDK